jgi:hypothetical protein
MRVWLQVFTNNSLLDLYYRPFLLEKEKYR